MNEMEKQFQHIADGLVKNDQPDSDYVRQLRQRTLAACRQVSSCTVSPGNIRPVWRNIMIKTAVAAMILAGAFLTIQNLKEPVTDNTGTTQNTQPGTENNISPAQLNLARELKLAAELYEARDIQGLAGLLKTGSEETKLAVINYLSNIGTDEALKVLKDYQTLSADPNLILAIQKAIVPAKLSETPAGDSVTSKETPNTTEPNVVVTKNILTPAEPNPAQQKPQDIDNDKEGFLGLKVVDSSSGKAIKGAKLILDTWGAKTIKTDVFGRTVFEVGDIKNVDITIRVRVNAKGFVPKYLNWSPRQNGVSVPMQHTVNMTPGVTVGGVIKTKEGQPIEGATVGLSTDFISTLTEFDYLDSRRDFATTDNEGRWTFEEFPKNISECSIELKHPDYVSTDQYSSNPPVEQLLNQNCILYMQKGLHIAGRVTNKDGQPVAEAVIYEGQSRYTENKVKTDSEGKYIFERCSPAATCLTVVAKGYSQDMRMLTFSESLEDIDFVLMPGNTLAIRVVDIYGTAVKGVKIQGETWRINRWDQPAETIRCNAETDQTGRVVLEDLPADEVGYEIYADNYASLRKYPLTASPNEQVITLWPRGKLKGKIYDAQTGQLVEIFTFTEGVQWQGQNGPTWQTMKVREATNGSFEFPFNYHTEGYAVKIEADGYLPYESQTFYNEGKEVILDVKLSKSAGICGVVLGPDGKAAKNTDVAIGMSGVTVRIQNCKFEKNNRDMFTQTDPNGKFCILPQKEKYTLIAANEDGIGEVEEKEFLASGVIQLQKWGRIEGKVYSGLKPLAEQEIGVDPERMSSRQPKDIYICHGNIFSDPNGKFIFKRVCPGKASVYKLVPIDSQSKRVANQILVEILPGKTVTVKIGGGGRKVTGRLVCPDVAGVDFQAVDFTVYPPAQEIDFSQLSKITVPENFLLLSGEELQAFGQRMQSEMAPVFEKLSRSYQSVQCAVLTDAKGQFTIQDIAAGSYRVEAKFKRPDSKPTEYGNYIAKANFEITVPEAATKEEYDTVIDVGQFTVEMMTPGLEIGKSLPEIELMDLNGKPVSLDKFRDKYLVLDLGTFMSMPEKRDAAIEVLKTLYNAHKQAQQLEIVSMSISSVGMNGVDIIDKASFLKAYRYYAAQKEIPWPICTEITDAATSRTLNPFEKFSYKGRTAQYILLDPQGVIVAIPENEEQLTEKINQLFQSQ